jgi:hypothetical protein
MKKIKRTNFSNGDRVVIRDMQRTQLFNAEFVSELQNDKCKVCRDGIMVTVPDASVFPRDKTLPANLVNFLNHFTN